MIKLRLHAYLLLKFHTFLIKLFSCISKVYSLMGIFSFGIILFLTLNYCALGQNVYVLQIYLEPIIQQSLVWVLRIKRGERHSSHLQKVFFVVDRNSDEYMYDQNIVENMLLENRWIMGILFGEVRVQCFGRLSNTLKQSDDKYLVLPTRNASCKGLPLN